MFDDLNVNRTSKKTWSLSWEFPKLGLKMFDDLNTKQTQKKGTLVRRIPKQGLIMFDHLNVGSSCLDLNTAWSFWYGFPK